jgi:hypothetical protein
VLADLQHRFGVGRICVVADRALISADNVDVVTDSGFGHVLATKLHRDPTCAEAFAAAAAPDAVWVPVPDAHSATCDVSLDDGRRAVLVASFERCQRDTLRTAELVAGRYVLVTSLDRNAASTATVVRAYRPTAGRRAPLPGAQGLLASPARPPLHRATRPRSRRRVRLRLDHRSPITAALAAADVRDPDLPNQDLSVARALRESDRIRRATLATPASPPPTGTAPRSPDQRRPDPDVVEASLTRAPAHQHCREPPAELGSESAPHGSAARQP